MIKVKKGRDFYTFFCLIKNYPWGAVPLSLPIIKQASTERIKSVRMKAKILK